METAPLTAIKIGVPGHTLQKFLMTNGIGTMLSFEFPSQSSEAKFINVPKCTMIVVWLIKCGMIFMTSTIQKPYTFPIQDLSKRGVCNQWTGLE